MATPVAELVSVSKRYSRRPGLRSVVAELMGRAARGSFCALRDVSLRVERGEQIGVVGANGAGKTTLLRVLAGVTEPTSGRRTVSGHVVALSEMQACLHRELTGRENLPLLATLAGSSPRDVVARRERILEFAGLSEQLLDVPVKDYSAGMGTRLAVSVAAMGNAELIMVDEGIAGADVAFRHRCFERLGTLAAAGSAVVLASHDLAEIRRYTRRCLLLDAGRVAIEGSPDDVLDAYYTMWAGGKLGASLRSTFSDFSGSIEVRVDIPKTSSNLVSPREVLPIEVHYALRAPTDTVVLGVEVTTVDGTRVCLLRSPEGEHAWCLQGPRGKAVVRVARLGLSPGVYRVNAFAWDASLSRCLHASAGPSLRMGGRPDPWAGPIEPPEHEWSLD
jgi:ABC-type polysaccharide/polyol phosphate transport system ATPase subunit